MARNATAAKISTTVERTRDDKGRYTDIMERENLEQIRATHKTKSASIRYLLSQGYAPGSIAKFLGVLYQHVNNVSKQKPKRAAAPSNSVASS